MSLKQPIERFGAGKILRQAGNKLLRKNAGKEAVHSFFEIADGHRPKCVAMIAALEGGKAAAPCVALVEPKLHRHFHGDLDRDRAAVAEKNPLEPAGQECRKAARERKCGLVHEAAEHNM